MDGGVDQHLSPAAIRLNRLMASTRKFVQARVRMRMLLHADKQRRMRNPIVSLPTQVAISLRAARRSWSILASSAR